MKHSEVKIEDTWNLDAMFASPKKWDALFAHAETEYAKVQHFVGRLSEKDKVLACLRLCDTVNQSLELLYVYAACKRDEDQADEEANQRYARITGLITHASEVQSAIQPELSKLPKDVLQGFQADPDFADYDYMFKRILDNKPYILSEKEERLLALSGDFSDAFGDIFEMLDNVDLKLPEIAVDEKSVQLTHGTYSVLLQHPRQAVRAEAFNAYYTAYEGVKNTLTANYSANIKKDIFYTKARGYASFLERALLAEDVPVKVYRSLLDAVHAALPSMYEYVDLRKKFLNLDKIYMYDLYCPTVKDSELKVDYAEAQRLVFEALAPLGEDYRDRLKEAFADRWVDVYECEGKRSGGYCTHAGLAPHPYILLNYSRTTHDVFTLAHELGHAMHSHYSAKNQPPAKADYRIFVAEVASTTNEMQLLEYLLRTTEHADFKKFLLCYRLDMLRTTIFRQTMFSEFEHRAHEWAEEDTPLTTETLSDEYERLNRLYYGDAIEKDPHIRYEWMRIPHFYYNFYVYKYATGLIAAVALSRRILSGEAGALERYQRFLSAGGSKSPYEILCDAGVDLAAPDCYQEVFTLFRETLNQLKQMDSGGF